MRTGTCGSGVAPEAGEGQLLGVAVAVGSRSAAILCVWIPPRQDFFLLLLLLLLPLLCTATMPSRLAPAPTSLP